MPDKTFSGYHILAYFYVSWAIAMPEVLHELQLPFDKEYEGQVKILGISCIFVKWKLA
jgi:hypothetical protein